MTAIELLACAGLITGVFLILGLKPTEFTDGLFEFLIKPKGSIREDIREIRLEQVGHLLHSPHPAGQHEIICQGHGCPPPPG